MTTVSGVSKSRLARVTQPTDAPAAAVTTEPATTPDAPTRTPASRQASAEARQRAHTSGSAPLIKVGSQPLGPPSEKWEGVGTHANTGVYDHHPGVPRTSPAAIAKGEQQIANLHAQVTRVRVDPKILQLQDHNFKTEDPQGYKEAKTQLAELKHLTTLATKNGGRADLCLWDLPKGHRTSPAEMKQIANRYGTLVKQLVDTTPNAKPGQFIVSAQNEPNRTKLSPQQVVNLYTDVDGALTHSLGADGRKQVRVIAGDMTGGDDSAGWIKQVVPKLGGKVDGFSFHVYAHEGESADSVEGRLRTIRHDVDSAMPHGIPKPELLLTEYGVRGHRPQGTAQDRPGNVMVDGKPVPLRDSPVGAFREAQLVLAASRTGFSGALRWGSNAGGSTPWNSWSMTGNASSGFAKKPAYNVTQLFTTAVGHGWRPEQTEGKLAGESVATFRGPHAGDAAAVVANSKTHAQPLQLGGFKPNAAVQVLVWNDGGHGKLVSHAAMADDEGNVHVTVPPGGVSAATTLLAPPVLA